MPGPPGDKASKASKAILALPDRPGQDSTVPGPKGDPGERGEAGEQGLPGEAGFGVLNRPFSVPGVIDYGIVYLSGPGPFRTDHIIMIGELGYYRVATTSVGHSQLVVLNLKYPENAEPPEEAPIGAFVLAAGARGAQGPQGEVGPEGPPGAGGIPEPPASPNALTYGRSVLAAGESTFAVWRLCAPEAPNELSLYGRRGGASPNDPGKWEIISEPVSEWRPFTADPGWTNNS